MFKTQTLKERVGDYKNSFRFSCMALDKSLLNAEAVMRDGFKENKDLSKLRTSFYNLRLRHLKDCLIVYADDVVSTFCDLSEKDLNTLLNIKLNVYIKRFENDLSKLFEESWGVRWKNKNNLNRFESAGNKFINQLSQRL